MLDVDLDDALERLAVQRDSSKSALIREFVRDKIQPPSPVNEDPVWRFCGIAEFEAGDVDDVVYPR